MRRLGLENFSSGPTDGLNAMFACSVKSGGRFNEADWREIEKQGSLHPDKVAFLLKVETPGRGRRARATVTLDVEDWIALHVADPD